jgi:CHAD domain-containing protein
MGDGRLAHRIGRHEAIGDALWRLLHDDVRKARRELAADGRREERIHRVRQRLKRARSVLTVLAPGFGSSASDIRRTLSGAGRLLAGARDADVAAATARGLRETAVDGDAGLDRVVAKLDRKAVEAHRHTTPVDEVIDRLAAVEARLAEVGSDFDGEKCFGRAIAGSYKKGRKAMRRARSSLSTPDLHAWRKRVKDLWHLVRLGRKQLPPRVAGMAEDLARLGDVLGFDHDHAVLAERLALAPDADHSLMRQLSMIAAERRALEKEAFALGAKLYDRKPKAFAKQTHSRI